jgi:hypothetical protein
VRNRYRGHLDKNHAAICQTFRRLGWTVAETSAQARFVDCVIARRGVTVVCEIKRPEKCFGIGQLEFLASWPGLAAVVVSEKDAHALTRNPAEMCLTASERETLAAFCAAERMRGATDDKEFTVSRIMKLLGRI